MRGFWVGFAMILIAFGQGGSCIKGGGPDKSLVSTIVDYLERH